MHGELQKRKHKNGMPPTGAGKRSSEHHEDHPRGGDGDVDLVAQGMRLVWPSNEMREVAPPRLTVKSPVVEGYAEEDREGEVHCRKEVGCAVARGEVDGGAQTGEQARPVGWGRGQAVEAEGAVGPADEGGSRGDSILY